LFFEYRNSAVKYILRVLCAFAVFIYFSAMVKMCSWIPPAKRDGNDIGEHPEPSLSCRAESRQGRRIPMHLVLRLSQFDSAHCDRRCNRFQH
jgi:hypothetical protein